MKPNMTKSMSDEFMQILMRIATLNQSLRQMQQAMPEDSSEQQIFQVLNQKNREMVMDKNVMDANELLNKHEEAQKKEGFMSKNNSKDIKMDSKSILQRAPKLVIANIDPVQQILPKDRIFINAFGVVEGMRDLSYIPPDIQKSLDDQQKFLAVYQQFERISQQEDSNMKLSQI